jgi:hypothetical protein
MHAELFNVSVLLMGCSQANTEQQVELRGALDGSSRRGAINCTNQPLSPDFTGNSSWNLGVGITI